MWNKSLLKISYLLPIVFFIISLPLLSDSPQNPDGAEIITVAKMGGNLHAPGYPLQAWAGRFLLVFLPETSFSWGFSCFSLLLTSLGLALFLASHQQNYLSSRITGFAFLAFYPALWYMAVQPEKYALLFFLLSLLTYFSHKKSFHVSWVFGLCIAQHPLAILFIPYYFIPLERILKRRKKVMVFQYFSTSFAVCAVAYLSLFLLSSEDRYPDWGKIQNISQWLDFLLRKDQSSFQAQTVFNQSAEQSLNHVRALSLFFEDLFHSFSVLFLFAPIGLLFLLCSGSDFYKNRKTISLCCTLLLCFIFLFFIRHPKNLVLLAYTERYLTVAILPFASLVTIGHQHLLNLFRNKKNLQKYTWFPGALAGLAVLLGVLNGHQRADASQDRWPQLFRQALSLHLNDDLKDGLYFSGSDLESLWGVLEGTKTRFPFFADYEWLTHRVNQKIEPRLPDQPRWALYEIREWAVKNGIPMFSSSPSLLKHPGVHIESQGLIYVAKNHPPKTLWGALPSLRDYLSIVGKRKSN